MTMASIAWEGKNGDLAKLVWRSAAGRQMSLRLGRCTKRTAQNALIGFERVLESDRAGSTLHPDGIRWLEAIDDRIHSRVVKLGLAESRPVAEVVTLGALLSKFFEATDVKPSTLVRMRQVETALLRHFDEGHDAAKITEADADQWRAKLKAEGYAPATISRTVLYARQMFRWAERRKLVNHNPLAELRAGPQTNPSRTVFIDRQTISRVIDAAPDAEWRLLIALSRFGGLRVPSEALALRWSDVDWAHNGLTVRSSKTEHHEGKGERIIPLFPEIREPLMEVFELAPEGAESVITRYRQGSNLNPQLHRIIKRAGLKAWPRVWHNLRASRQTELATSYPLHTVCAWIGNTKAIASGHYLQVTDADWKRAVGGDSQKAATNPATQVRPSVTNAAQAESSDYEKHRDLRGFGRECAPVESRKVGRGGLEPPTPAFSVQCSTN